MDDTLLSRVSRAKYLILVENIYKCKGFGAKTLIREFPDGGWNVRSLNRLLKKLRDCVADLHEAARDCCMVWSAAARHRRGNQPVVDGCGPV